MKNSFNFFITLLSFLSIAAIAQNDNLNKTDAAGKKQGHWIKLDDDKKNGISSKKSERNSWR